MEIEMKKQILTSLLIVAALIGLNTVARAQSQRKWTGNVPFEFTAGGKTFAAGDYVVKIVNPSSDRPVLVVQNAKTRESVIVQATSGTGKASDDATLQFRRYGDSYFFAVVQLAGESTNLTIAKSKAERAIRSEWARNGGEATMVAVKHK